jgi:hypothetical protein
LSKTQAVNDSYLLLFQQSTKMPISNRIVQHCSALTNRTLPVTARIQPFSISASTLDEKKAKEQEPRSVTHNYFESLKDYDEEQNASYEKDRVAGSFWGGDPGQVKQPGDENEVKELFMHTITTL